jgi:predicted CoA-binding protein
MKPQEVIKYMKDIPEDFELICIWWNSNDFPDVAKEVWDTKADRIQMKMDWSKDHEVISEMLDWQ